MWWGVIIGLLVACAKVVYDMVRGVGTPTVHLQHDRHLWALLRAHRLPAETVKQLDALVGTFIKGEPFGATELLRAQLSSAPEPVRKAAEELIAKYNGAP